MGRYQITVVYEDRNPDYVEPPPLDYQFGTDRDRREPHERAEFRERTVLSCEWCELTPEQFVALKYETLKVWQAQLIAPIVMDK